MSGTPTSDETISFVKWIAGFLLGAGGLRWLTSLRSAEATKADRDSDLAARESTTKAEQQLRADLIAQNRDWQTQNRELMKQNAGLLAEKLALEAVLAEVRAELEQERDERKKMRFELDRLGGLLRAIARLVPEVARLLPADMKDDEFDAIDITGAFQRMREIHEEE